jgi:Flp pilus assembly protein TadG
MSGMRVHTGLGRLAGFCRDIRAVSAVEFAIILPVMLLVFIGGNQFAEAIAIKRKVTMVARAVADLVSQDPSVTNADMTSIFNAATAVAAPFPAAPLLIIVSNVSVDAQGTARIAWSDSSPTGSARAVNSTVTLPPNMNVASSTWIWTETSYTYTPPVAFTMFSVTNTGAFTLTDTAYFRPRTGTTIARVP